MARKGGNPDIVKYSKERSTGPKTKEGKRKVAMNLIKNGRYSKTMMDYRKGGCNNCALGEKEIKMRIGKQETTRIKPALCPHYKKNSRKCTLPVEGMVARLKNYELLSDIDTFELQKQMVVDAYGNAKQAEIVEMLDKGRAGFYTKEFSELAMKYLNELNKMQIPQRIQTENKNLNMNVDMTQAIIDAYKKDKESDLHD